MEINKFNFINTQTVNNKNTNSFKGFFKKVSNDSFVKESKSEKTMPIFETTFKNAKGKNVKIGVVKGDITKLDTDAIVNAANVTLLGGGGVDGAIHRAAGRGLLEECITLGGCEIGDAKITKGYNLPAKHVIHTVGPDCRHQTEDLDEDLSSCYKRSLEVATENGVETIAFPAISCGVFAFPLRTATKIATDTVKDFIANDNGNIKQVLFVGFDDKTANEYISALK